MATEGSDLSTRMSAEEQEIYNTVKEAAGKLFKKYKVDISGAIKATFPFLELLRDRGFITSEKYAASQAHFVKRFSVQEVIYDLLSELEETFDLPLLDALFSKVIVEKYPDLKRVYRFFICGVPNIKKFLESDAEENWERSGILPSIEPGAGENTFQSMLCSRPHSSNQNGLVTSDNGFSEQLLAIEETNAVETGPAPGNSDALESQPANEQRAQEPDPAGAELPDHGIPVNSFPVSLENIKKEKTSFPADVEWEAQGRTGCNPSPEIIVIGSEGSTEHRDSGEPPEASPSAQKRKAGAADLGKPPTSQKAKRRKRAGQHPDVSVDFAAEILPVTCREVKGNLIKRKLKRGATVKCIRSEDGNWFTPREFEVKGDLQKASNWKTSLMCGGKTLRWLMEDGKLPKPQTKYGRNKKGGNPNKCKICQDEGKLFRCEKCRSFFHGDCHLPPLDTKGINWNCTLCVIENSSRSQQRYKESEVLVKPMGPEEELKCEFLLLRVHQHLETIVFQNIPHENYVKEASQCLVRLRELEDIKSRLTNRGYSEVNNFVQAMNKFFTVPECNDSDLTKKEFEKNFKKVFAIQETNYSNSLL